MYNFRIEVLKEYPDTQIYHYRNGYSELYAVPERNVEDLKEYLFEKGWVLGDCVGIGFRGKYYELIKTSTT